MVRVNLLFGFLGAGKTTLVRRLLTAPVDDLKTAVIVNEFGEVGVDGQILSGANVDILELTSGCLCCTLKGSLVLAMEELRDLQGVQRVIVEASGVAQPAEMLESLAEAGEPSDWEVGPLVTVVDAAKLPKWLPMLGEFYARQIANADIIVLNKADLVATAALDAASRRVRELNARADILLAEQCDVDGGYLLGSSIRAQPGMARSKIAEPAATPGEAGNAALGTIPLAITDDQVSYREVAAPCPQPGAPADSFVIASAGATRRNEIEAFFRGLGDDVWRVKGYIAIEGEPCLVQYTPGQLEITPDVPRTQGYLVFIGRGMDRDRIERGLRLAAAA